MTALAGHVFEWREEPFAESELPAVEYRDPTMETVANTLQTWMQTLAIVLRINAKTMKETREIQASIDAAFGLDTTLGQWGLIIDRMRDETSVRHEENKYFSSTIVYNIMFTTAQWNHYA